MPGAGADLIEIGRGKLNAVETANGKFRRNTRAVPDDTVKVGAAVVHQRDALAFGVLEAQNVASGELLDVVDPKQVWLAPDCGLMTISRELASEKLRVIVKAAHELRSEL